MLRIAAPVAIVLFALSTIAAGAAPHACPGGGFSACVAKNISLGNLIGKADAICGRRCGKKGRAGKRAGSGRTVGAGKKAGGRKEAGRHHARSGKKCAKGYSGCLSYKMKLGSSAGQAATICSRVCGKS